MPSFGDFLHAQLIAKIPKPTASFSSETVIITGANTGLGKEAARKIVALGASKVIIGCRDISKGKAAKLDIESSLSCSTSIIEVWRVDLSSYDSVREFAVRAKELPRLDVLLNNAGLMNLKFQLAEGTELNMTVNVISTFLLSLLLIPKLRETARTHGTTPHLTFVTSALYDVASFPPRQKDIFAWQALEKNNSMMSVYNLTKLFQILVIRELASIIHSNPSAADAIVIDCLDPMMCKTDLGRSFPKAVQVIGKVFQAMFARSAEEGARCLVLAASAGRELHGGYMRAGVVRAYAPVVTSAEGVQNSKYVWEQLAMKLEKIQPGIVAGVTA
ncbi:hypothetical protein MMC18_009200 [Xylographa bjoerkii]|nr:hypothetical protein [Xylographa bjoerkii]